MKGYELKIKAFIPFDPTDLFTSDKPTPKATADKVEAVLKEGGAIDVVVVPKHRQRKKEADLPLGLDGGAAE